MKVSLFSEKKTPDQTLRQIVLVSFLLTATDESASARNVQIVGTTQKKKKKKKKRWGQGEREKKPSFLPLLSSAFFPPLYG